MSSHWLEAPMCWNSQIMHYSEPLANDLRTRLVCGYSRSSKEREVSILIGLGLLDLLLLLLLFYNLQRSKMQR